MILFQFCETLKRETNETTVIYVRKGVSGNACFTTETKTALFKETATDDLDRLPLLC